MTAVSENPAALDPRAALTLPQRDALITIGFFRRQTLVGAHWRVGKKRFAIATVAALEKMELLRRDRSGLSPTLAGQVAIARLQGKTQ